MEFLGESSVVSSVSVAGNVSGLRGFYGSQKSGLVQRRPVVAMATLGDLQESVARRFNNLIRRHCARAPQLGSWASISHESLCEQGELGKTAPVEVVGEEPTQPSGQNEKKRKTVLILMSDTGGGHRASAEAIKATFELEYGDDYQVGCAI